MVETTISRKQELQRKAAVLKQYEVYCYQMAYFLLEDEALAAQAAKQALFHLLNDETFFLDHEQLQKQKTKQITIKYALQTKSALLQQAL
ncbi:hypothetical protein FHS15_000278 [Paenibacillus castaneae]|uniref:hypothetical protein n=1 Tax=Paenibacillus castaneae TaxID=474957 RepID=UPI000C9C3A70|nr:hypothetical protein [Paenibacillus castaneae]NIK75180.1 hypothetical protein [Paenibacillus castaneae]